MIESTVRVLDDKDLEFIALLESIEVPRNVAKLLSYLRNVDEASSRDIEKGAGLRQPEVSLSMRTLRGNGWVDEREIKSAGKGRPMKIYKLTIPIDEILEHFEMEKRRESADAIEVIQKLKDMKVPS